MHFYPNGRMKEVYYKLNNYYYVLVKSVFDGDSLIEVHEDWYKYKTDYMGEYVSEKDRVSKNVHYIIPSGKNNFITKLNEGRKLDTRCFCLDNNHLSSSLQYNSTLVEYLYDKIGNLTEYSVYKAKKFEKGKFIHSNFFEYDSDGRIKSWRTSELDTLVSTFEYDENGFINEYIFWHCYGPYRNNFVKCRISCKNDIMGNPLEYRAESLDEYYNSHGGAVDFIITNCLAVGVFDYEYDKNGNYISKRYTLNGVLQYVVERDIEYY